MDFLHHVRRGVSKKIAKRNSATPFRLFITGLILMVEQVVFIPFFPPNILLRDHPYIASATNYSVDSIKHTVLLKILLPIFLLISIKSTVHWKFSRQINLRTVSINNAHRA